MEKKGLWIRFDIPYQKDANLMRAVFGYSTPNEIQFHLFEEIPHVPFAIEQIQKFSNENSIKLDEKLTLVYPIDNRHNLAWMVKDNADKNNWQFERYIPVGQYPNSECPFHFELMKTGSKQDQFSKDQARKEIMNLMKNGYYSVKSAYFSEGFDSMHQAMQLTIQHFGWLNSISIYSIVSLLSAYLGLGNQQNYEDCLFLFQRLKMLWSKDKIDVTEWTKTDWENFETLKKIAEKLKSSELKEFIISFIQDEKPDFDKEKKFEDTKKRKPDSDLPSW